MRILEELYRKLKIILAILISLSPTSKLRCFLYKLIFGYKIYKSFIGWKTVIVVNNANLDRCRISGKNRFIGPMNISINKNSSIGSSNIFICGLWTIKEQFENSNYESNLLIEEDTLITENHYIDLAGSFTLSKKSWIAGNGSQFWTHGAGVSDHNIFIGENCYIGSAVRFAPGSSIGKNSLIGLGSIVTKKFTKENVIIAGQPAKIIREDYNWETQKHI